MSELNLDLLRKLCDERQVIWSDHIHKRLNERGLNRKDVYNVLCCGKIIEQYPDDYPHPSCLISGKDLKGNPLHIVVACNGAFVTMITAYFPTPQKFEKDMETRKEKLS